MSLAAKAARGKGAEKAAGKSGEQEIRSGKRLLGKLKTGSSGVTLTIPKQEAAFGTWLGGRLEQLYAEFERTLTAVSTESVPNLSPPGKAVVKRRQRHQIRERSSNDATGQMKGIIWRQPDDPRFHGRMGLRPHETLHTFLVGEKRITFKTRS
ncbi:hypothetical protein V6L77_01485 [Pannonibacter sp. Pt2-lr]